MEIQIVDCWADIVRVNSAIGCFNGVWCSSLPAVAKRYIVELDSDEVLTPEAVEASNSSKPWIAYVDQTINLTGLVEAVQDEVMILRLHDSLMMIEISSMPDFVQYVGRYVHVRLGEIKLYDTGIC